MAAGIATPPPGFISFLYIPFLLDSPFHPSISALLLFLFLRFILFFFPRFLPFVAVFCSFRFSSPRRRFVRNTLEAYGVSMAEMYSVPTQTTMVFAETNDTPAENALTKTAECLSNG